MVSQGTEREAVAERRRTRRRGRPDRAAWLAGGLLVGVLLALTDDWRAREPTPAAVTAGVKEALALKPAKWRGVLARSVRQFNQDSIPATAAGITYYMLLAIFPGLAAFVSLYGLVADVHAALLQLETLGNLLPGGAIEVLRDQLTRLAQADHGALGLAFVASLAISIWSANAGASALINGLNIAYEAHERRGFVHRTLLSLSFTAGAILLAVFTVSVLANADPVLARLGLESLAGLALLRWPFLLAIIVLLLSLLYRYGPARLDARWRWVTPGGLVAAIAWLVMSAAFSAYVANFGHYDRVYGSLGAIVGFLTWIWLSLLVVLFGAELNDAIEHAVEQPRR
jgi:membrane protein